MKPMPLSMVAAEEQTTNNATCIIGHLPGSVNSIAGGQTFVSRKEGDLNKIEIFTNLVTHPGNLQLTFFDFDEGNETWGRAKGSTRMPINSEDSGHWIAFDLSGLHLDKGKPYGFLLESNDTCIGLGEGVSSAMQPPLSSGKEWKFTSHNDNGKAYSYFSLTYRIGLTA